jgi:phosphoenolpyruvate carboxykinase (ATP)
MIDQLIWQGTRASLTSDARLRINQPDSGLVEDALQRGQASLVEGGSITFGTAPHTGRSPRDKFTVADPSLDGIIDWGDVNQALPREGFEKLLARMLEHLGAAEDLWVQELHACTDPRYRLNVRLVTELASHALFARTLFLRPTDEDLANEAWTPDFTILHAPSLLSDPATEGTRSETAIVVDLQRKVILIAGTRYAGEIKKSIFGILQYLLPQQGVASMHCSANMGDNGDVAIFFGLSGTGKTTLSADPNRAMIGDDEHGWSEHGVFNFEGGIYAKVIKLTPESEPEIYRASTRYPAILENVTIDPVTRQPDFFDGSVTENTRSAFRVGEMPRLIESGMGGHPKHVLMLTADAFGVMPPVARLTPEQAMFYFLSGYTAKVAGTERGVKEPEETFSACFGAPFLSLHPSRYAELLGERIRTHKPGVWLVNTGWTGGPYGVGHRMSLPYTRAIVTAIVEGALDDVATHEHPILGLAMPVSCPGVPDEILDPRSTWEDKAAYDTAARKLAADFRKNFERFAAGASAEIALAAPQG